MPNRHGTPSTAVSDLLVHSEEGDIYRERLYPGAHGNDTPKT